MTTYELSISPNYVPDWGIVEAIRELFQNALDEATRDPENTMYFNYDSETEVLRIGNAHSKLDAKTLLLGCTEKSDQAEMIGNHGEGYKLATIVLLRLNKKVVFYNYGYRQIWTPKFVKSRKYGTLVPTFFVETKHSWDDVPNADLTIEISGITAEEYAEIEKHNLHLSPAKVTISTDYGQILLDENLKGKVFVSGLYICENPDISVGVNLHPWHVRLERDRTMVDTFDLQWCVSKMIAESKDLDLIDSMISQPSGCYIDYKDAKEAGEAIAEAFLTTHGTDAVPAADQRDVLLSDSPNTVIMSRTKRDFILESNYYRTHSTVVPAPEPDDSDIAGLLRQFAIKHKRSFSEADIAELSKIIQLIKDKEAKK